MTSVLSRPAVLTRPAALSRPVEASPLPLQRATPPARAGVDALLAGATEEVLVMSGLADRAPLGGLGRVDHDNARRGVRYRVLVPDRARVDPALAPRLGALSAAGASVRTVADVPTDALVVDGAVVVLAADREWAGPPTGTAAFRLPSIVATTTELFERVWSSAVPLTATRLPDNAELGPRERELLELLAAGHTDQSAAARLGVSVRTVRRMVSDLMNRLGARSRFQAGAKATDRGWLAGW